MRLNVLPVFSFFLASLFTPILLNSQNCVVRQVVNDTFEIELGSTSFYNVTANDVFLPGSFAIPYLLEPSKCFELLEGRLRLIDPDNAECCGEYRLPYTYEGCENEGPIGFIFIKVKCPKPECFVVNLEDYLMPDRPDDNDMEKGCAYACELSDATYFVTYNPLNTYNWSVIGGTYVAGSNAAEIMVSWGSKGTGTISLTITDVNNEATTIEICVEILERPTAAFIPVPAYVCRNSPISFTNNSTGANDYFWDFGDGNTSNAFEPVHQYAGAGTYTVTLYATRNNYDDKGNPLCCCTDSTTVEVEVDPLEGPNIYWISTLCANDSSKYWTDALNCGTYEWTVLDETGTPIPFVGQGNDTICVQWGNGPIGTLMLKVDDCDQAYCDLPTTVTIPIIPPSVDIDGQAEVCENEVATYSVPKWTSVAYDWQISGGTILSGENSHTVVVQWGSAPGPGKLTLNYNSEFLGGLPGQNLADCEGMAMISVAIKPVFEVFSQARSCVNSNSFVSATLSPSSAYTWTISPAASFTGQGTSSIVITWNNGPGIYDVTAVPIDPNVYCNDTVRVSIKVEELPPPDAIVGPIEVCPGETVTYFGQSSRTDVAFIWTVTGGVPAFSTGNPLTVTWNNTGPYSITLQQFQFVSPFCFSDPISLNVQPKLLVEPLAITGTSACINEVSSYSAGPTQHPDAIFNWSISPVAAGSVISGQGTPNVQVQWNNDPGTAVLSLTVDLCDASGTTTLSVPLNAPVVPVITQTGDLCPGLSATLDAGSGFGSYLWSTGSMTQTITITTGGTYTLTTTDGNGCQAITSFVANELPGPIANISTPDPTVLCINPPNSNTVTLSAQTNPGYTFTWYCNGVAQITPPTQSTFTHTNNNSPGNFDYWAVVTDINGCMANTDTIRVVQEVCTGGPPCNSAPYSLDISAANPVPACNVVNFSTSLSPNVTPTGWDFGDPNNNVNTGTLTNAIHTYDQAGYYLVYFNATVPRIPLGTGNCLLKDTVSVCIPLAADFDYQENCQTVSFTDLSTFLSGNNITGWSWDFGDFNVSALQNPTHTYAFPGNYTVTLTVSNGAGCQATISYIITVDGGPNPSITANPNPVCVGDPVSFMGTGTNIIQWTWDFDDGATNGNQNPSHTYLNPGTYDVTLSVVNEEGCLGTATQSILVHPAVPEDTIAYSPSLTICDGETVTLTAPPGSGYTYLWNTGATTASLVVSTSGTYGVTVTDANNCTLIPDSLTIIVLPVPPAFISGNLLICDEGCTTLSAPLGAGYTYQWLDHTNTPIPSANASNFSVCDDALLPAYSVMVTDANGCSATSAPVTVSVVVSPDFMIDVVPDSCEGSASLLTVNPVMPDVVYAWSNGNTGSSITVFQAGTYTVVGTDTITGCTHVESQVIYPLPDMCLVPVGCYEVCNPDTICGPPGLAVYQWNLNGIPIAGANDPCLIVTSSGAYSLTGTTEFGCTLTSDTLILSVIGCSECDNLMAELESLTDGTINDCCWSVSYQNDYGSDLLGLMISTPDADFDFNLGSLDPSLGVYTIGSNWIGLVNSTANTPLPEGNLGDFLNFCLKDIQNRPQQIVFDWYNFDFEVVCSDTLELDCLVEPDCLYLAADSIYCKDGVVVYDMTVCNPIDADFSVAYIQVQPSGPSGIIVTPSFIDETSNPILAGECRTYTFTLSGPNIAGEEYCFNLLAHSADPNVDETALCCSLDTMYCIKIPDCDPCDDIGVEQVVASTKEGCCYQISIYNNYDPAYFDGIDLCLLTPNTSMTINNPFGSDWITSSYTPTVISLVPNLPSGNYLPTGVLTLPELCFETEQPPVQLLEIKWMKDGEVVCRDTVELKCEPDCGYLLKEEIICKDDGTWNYSFGLVNNSNYVMGEATFAFTSPSGMNIYDQTLPLSSLAPGGVQGLSLILGPPAMPGDEVCFTVILHELGHDNLHLNCCEFTYCIVLPKCPSDDCLCDEAFVDAVNKGFDLDPSPPGLGISFTPAGLLSDCDEVIWDWGDGSPASSSIGNASVIHTFNAPNSYQVCMLVIRKDINGILCERQICREILVVQPTSINLSVYPNPSRGSYQIRFSSSISGRVQFRLMNIHQEVISEWSVEDPPAEGLWVDHLGSIPSALYILEARTEQDRWVKKILIQQR